MIINGFDTNKKVMIVAEIGNNHEGKISLAKKMINLAHKAGADAVKFQTFKVEKFILSKNKKRFEKLKKFQLTYNEFRILKSYTLKKKMIFISTPLDLDSALFVSNIAHAIKISSGDNNFYELIKMSINKKKSIIISTGMTTQEDIKKLLNYIKKNVGLNYIRKKVALLHCVTSYPVADEYANLKSIPYLKDKFNLLTGYSDHTLGNEACIAAVALGARIIEKHFTFDKKYSSFRDHSLSADYKDLKNMVLSIRKIEKMMGIYKKDIQKIEKPFQISTRRAMYSSKDIEERSLLNLKKVDFLRPGPSSINLDLDKIKKKKIRKFLKKGTLINNKDLY